MALLALLLVGGCFLSDRFRGPSVDMSASGHDLGAATAPDLSTSTNADMPGSPPDLSTGIKDLAGQPIRDLATADLTTLDLSPPTDLSVHHISYVSAVTPDAPLMWWRLGDASGTTAADSSGNNHAGVYSGSLFHYPGANGLIGNASDEDGDVDLTNGAITSPALPQLGSFSVEFWHHGDNVNGGGNFDDVGDPGQHFFWVRNANGGVQCGFNDTHAFNSTDLAMVDGNGTHHHVFTWDGGNGRYYYDGTLVATKAMTGPSAALTQMSIGPSGGGYIQVAATFDEFAVYNTVLSAPRIAAHYIAGSGY